RGWGWRGSTGWIGARFGTRPMFRRANVKSKKTTGIWRGSPIATPCRSGMLARLVSGLGGFRRLVAQVQVQVQVFGERSRVEVVRFGQRRRDRWSETSNQKR